MKRRAERELDEQRDLVTTYEKEITQLRGQLRRIMTSLQAGEVRLNTRRRSNYAEGPS